MRTVAREELAILVVVLANRVYQILRGQLPNVGVSSVGRNALRLLDVADPRLDWVALAKGDGVDGMRVTDTDRFVAAFGAAMIRKGPFLIEVVC